MSNIVRLANKGRRALSFTVILFFCIQGSAQKLADWELEKIPADLETDFALSSLPAHLRHDATVYLLDPGKGYYIARKGSNGFLCFVTRTEWEWGEFRKDIFTPISYDAEGARAIFPVYLDVAAMRASGKLTALQVRNTVLERIRKGIYKAPARTGISYMLGPIMRTYPGTPDSKDVMTMSMPHYMFYAPYLTNADLGGSQQEGPVVINPGALLLGERKGPYGYMILAAGETEKAKILAENAGLLKRLAAYRPYLKM